jgi:hypothetical protein
VLPPDVSSRIQRIDSLLPHVDQAVAAGDFRLQPVFASHIVLQGAGVIENGVREILASYAQARGNNQLKNFVYKQTGYENSLNAKKIENLLNRFDTGWWPTIAASLSPQEVSAINSLKDLRDTVAHGNTLTAGYQTVRAYYVLAKSSIAKISNVITP